MRWPELSIFVEWTVAVWLATLALAVLFRLVTGSISTSGMLRETLDGREPFLFHRLQLLAVTLMMAAGYLIVALKPGHGASMPDVSPPVLLAVAGSHLTFLGNKFASSSA